ncbi:MAG: hypothetical protein J5722_07395 [Oscillospiraceae bacterium]|nr:hypothetical protein [Oscillospiraceae bacterium]
MILYILILVIALAAAASVFRLTRSGKYAEKLRPAGVFLVRALTVCVMLELFVFNFHAAHLLGGNYPRKTLSLQNAYTENFDAASGHNPESGRTVLEFTDLNTPVGTLTVNGESDRNSMVKFTVDMKDETYRSSYRNGIAVLEAITGDKHSKTIPCNFSGTVYDLRISFDTAEGETVTISSVEINRPIGVRFSLTRLLLMMLLCAAVWFCRAPGRLPEKSLKPLAGLLTACLLIFATYMTNMYRYTIPGHSIKSDLESYSGNQISQEIVDAFEAGQVTLEQTPNEDILSLQNPYDGSQRDASGAYYLWDHLLYDGKYYSYYGIAPVLVLFLPYHMLTGYYFPTVWAVWLFAVIGIIFLTKLYLAAMERFAPKNTPVSLQLIGLAMVQFSSGIYFTLYNSSFYEIAQASGFVFVTAGAYFMIASNVVGEGKIRLGRLAASAACLSMGVLCRPTLAVYCVAALLFIWAGFRKKQLAYKNMTDALRKQTPKLRYYLPYFVCALLPFAVIGSVQVWYNWVRFGNPLDFGIQYSLTINDFTHTQFHTHFALLGIYSYLLAPPEFIERFPFFRAGTARTFDPQGYYFVATGAALGLLWRALPIAAYCKAGTAYRLSRDPEKRMNALLLAAVCVVCPLIIIFSIWESGYGTRYCVDFAWQMILGALLICFLIYDRCKENTKRHLMKVMTAAGLISLVMNFIQVRTYVDPTQLGNTEWQANALAFARLFEFWR